MRPTDASLHPWNVDFEWRLPTTDPAALSVAQLRNFDQLGFVVIDDLLDAETVARTVEIIDEIEAGIEAGLRTLEADRLMISEADAITFAPHLVARSEELRAVAQHPDIVALTRDLVGPDVRLYWDQAVYKKPEKPRRFPWHQDNGYTFVEPQQYLTVWVALTDATADNGCPWVAPGAHKRGTLAHDYVEPLGFECFDDCPDAVAAPVRAGGAVVFSSLTPHLTGPNTTDAVRKAYILQYAPTGAQILQGDPRRGPADHRLPADAPDRQFEVLRDGIAVQRPGPAVAQPRR